MAIDALVTKIKEYNPRADVTVLQRAYEFAQEAHCGQKRISGEDFIVHPLEVALILAELELDLESVVGGLLHDVVEDAGIGLEVIRKQFGDEVALLVDGVTKLLRLSYRSKEEHQAENLRKMFLAMAKDVRVILIKLADRLHNLRTLNYHTPAKQREIAQETLEIFAPLAHRLGIYRLKWEIEDLAFRYRDSEKYYELAHRLQATRSAREEYIRSVIELLRDKLAGMGMTADIHGRPKNLYSIYQKMLAQNKDLDEIFDILGVRVLVDSVKDCYAALGVVHTLWRPVPGRFKDYIAMPKSNMYQSLHTSIVGPEGELLEIQIRTWDMHRTAEYGIAAHWRYKAGGRVGDMGFDEKLAWLRQVLEWQHDLRDARDFMETLKIDLFADSVYVFTPMGDVMELPNGSVPLDFAYRIHTDLGHRCVGARINGKIVPLDYQLKTGDIVDIIKGKQASPSRDWLNLVQTSQAKSRIRQWFKREQREENVVSGRDALEREARKQGLELEHLRGERILEMGKRYNLHSTEDVYAAVALGVVTAVSLVTRLKEQVKPVLPEPVLDGLADQKRWSKSTQGVRVLGIDSVLVRLAHCCNPVPGDPVIGYITRGRGVSVHRNDCRNTDTWRKREPERLVPAVWDQQYNVPFQIRLEVSGMDRAGLLRDVMNVLSDMKISASWVTARGTKSKMATIDLTLEIRNLEQLNYIRQRIGRVRDVYEVKRVI